MARGINTGGDVVRTTVDGVDLATIWQDMQAANDLRNRDRDSLRAILTHRTTAVGDEVPQTSVLDDFEDMSEMGAPHSIRTGIATIPMGFNFKDRDLAARYSWRFLRDADAAQVEAVHQGALDADARQQLQSVMGALLNNTNRTSPEGLTVYPLWNADGVVPPEWNGVTFPGSHSHYLVSSSATFDGGDIRDAYQAVAHHGYGSPDVGGKVIVFLNPVQADAARGFVKGTAATDPFDYIPGASAPAYLTDQTIVGDRPPANVGAISIFGQYGAALLSESSLVPNGYVVAVATFGSNDQRNVIAFREHRRPEYQGLRQIPGSSPEYPLQDSYYTRSWGTGVRQRGGAAVVQVKASGSYDVPAAYQTVIA
ncbi:MAG: hypothetical protein QOI54_3186 [Actinomycetota bacterium]|jgi:hypothetical protein|nr:hypothetical protein [Actinomycetota bacterium]